MFGFNLNSRLSKICLSFLLTLFSLQVLASSPGACPSALDGITVVNMYESLYHPEAPTVLRALGQIYQNRDPNVQLSIDQKLTAAHAGREMTFQVKNPKTGLYDRFNEVPVNGQVMPLMKTDFDRLVRSTGPVLRALRALMQRAYSVPELTVESLGLSALPIPEAEIVLRVLKESIYFEPKLRGEQLIDYPFLPFSGVDGAIVDPQNPQPLFFELNLATPSGMSNNKQLRDDLKIHDPEIYAALAPYLAKDNSFTKLRKVMQASGKAWTRMDGITVAFSPGSYNGAHPDVAAIAREAGIPLVNKSDLYKDALGFIRLNTGNDSSHPVVNVIFNRREESFVFQSNTLGIPLISPRYTDLTELGKKLGLQLRSGVIYKFITDPNGEPIDIERGPNGEPLMQEAWDQLGRDPNRPNLEPGSLAEAMLSRKIFVSNLAGGVASDKRLFRIVSEYLAVPENGEPVAHPIRGLTPYALDKFYENPAAFVVKEPNNSGGTGVVFVNRLNPEAQQRLIDRVRKSPFDFEIQYLSNLVALPQAGPKSMGAQQRIFDNRIYIMMWPDGEVDADPNSQLVRIAPQGSFYSNTSQGGGYAIGVVLNSTPSTPHLQLVTPNPEVEMAGVSQRQMVTDLLLGFWDFYQDLDANKISEIDQEEKPNSLIYHLRELLPLLSNQDAALISKLRWLAQTERAKINSADIVKIKLAILDFLGRVLNSQSLAQPAIQTEVKRFISMHPELADLIPHLYGHGEWIEPDPLEGQSAHFKLRRLDQPVISIARFYNETSRSEKVEVAEYIHSDIPEFQQIIEYVRANGGAIHLMKARRIDTTTGRFAGWHFTPPFFWANLLSNLPTYLTPRIAIDLNQDRALSALHHELQHFKIFIELRDQNLRLGMSMQEATREAVRESLTRKMVVLGERQAIAAEMKADLDFKDHPGNRSHGMTRAAHFWEIGYINRVTYPEFSAVRNILYDAKIAGQNPDAPEVKEYLGEMLTQAQEIKRRALAFLSSPKAGLGGPADPPPKAVASILASWRRTTYFDLLTQPYGMERLSPDQTVESFKFYLAELCRERRISPRQCGTTSGRSRRL